MPAAVVVSILHAVFDSGEDGPWSTGGLPALRLVVATVVTALVNVPVNAATSRWNPAEPPPDWKRLRTRWERAQGGRAWLLLARLTSGRVTRASTR